MTRVVDAARYEAAPRFPEYLASVETNPELWQGVYRTLVIPADAAERLRNVAGGGQWRLLALSEDWCGDCVSTLPVIARLAELSGIELRVLERDANDDLMAEHLTVATRSIPVVMVLDQDFREHGWWGPRPAPVQRWYRNEGLLLPGPERSRRKRAWYARDRGRTTVAEVVETVERAARSALRP